MHVLVKSNFNKICCEKHIPSIANYVSIITDGTSVSTFLCT